MQGFFISTNSLRRMQFYLPILTTNFVTLSFSFFKTTVFIVNLLQENTLAYTN